MPATLLDLLVILIGGVCSCLIGWIRVILVVLVRLIKLASIFIIA